MDFSAILDEIASPVRAEAGEGYVRPGSSSFSSILDRLESAAPVADAAVLQAYFPEHGTGRTTYSASSPPVAEANLSLDPDDILFELDLDEARTHDELSVLRRRFARLNHPDRVHAELRERANARMTIANALIDAAAARLA